MHIEFDTLNATKTYHLMTQCIVPRPIAWVLTENEKKSDQGYNLAPFSYFNAVASAPPMVMISIGRQPDGSTKDTLVNIQRTGKLVIHIASSEHLDALNDSSATLAYGESEVTQSALGTTPIEGFALPRLSTAKVALACSLDHIHPIDTSSQALVFARIEHGYFSDEIVTQDQKGRIRLDESAIDPIARLGSSNYALLGKYVNLKRPD